jgi:adenylate cyclase 9
MDNVKLSRSVTNISGMTPSVPPSSPLGPVSASLNPSPILSTRPRIASLGKVTKRSNNKDDHPEQHREKETTCKKLSNASTINFPKIIININDDGKSNDVDDNELEHENDAGEDAINIITTTTTSNDEQNNSNGDSHLKTSLAGKLINWKITNFLMKKTDLINTDNTLVCSNEHNNDCDIIITNTKQQSEDVPFLLDQNGYQQIPIVIETTMATPKMTVPSAAVNTASRPSCHTLEIPTHHVNLFRTSSAKCHSSNNNNNHCDNNSSVVSQNSVFDDVIDIRSYISQSRSDLSPFNRSGSYRSQSGRTHGSGHGPHSHQLQAQDLSPTTGRPRSSTLVTTPGRERSCNLLGKSIIFAYLLI